MAKEPIYIDLFITVDNVIDNVYFSGPVMKMSPAFPTPHFILDRAALGFGLQVLLVNAVAILFYRLFIMVF
jgi:hypothetical protein